VPRERAQDRDKGKGVKAGVAKKVVEKPKKPKFVPK